MIKRAALSLALACGLAHAATPADWSALVDQVQPSVVNIEAYQPYPVSSRMWSLPGVHRTWLTNVFDWLRVQLDDQKAKKDPEARKAEGAGFFIESSGVILTASHVVDGAEKVFVSLADGRRFQADVVGLDEAADIGVLRVRTGKAAAVHFPALTPAAMTTVKVGQPVLAFGSPLGNSHSVSAGIISAKREDNNFLARDTFLQTDTPITFGNSGGVLVNSQGQAVGVVSYGAESGGVSFLVPIDRALRVAQSLMRGERQALACRAVFIPAKALQGIQS